MLNCSIYFLILYQEEWLTGIIIPIFKNKGSSFSPENYGPITLQCCCSKLFTTVLNNRLSTFIEENYIISEAQDAFSTADLDMIPEDTPMALNTFYLRLYLH